jgi:hypothetical protein
MSSANKRSLITVVALSMVLLTIGVTGTVVGQNSFSTDTTEFSTESISSTVAVGFDIVDTDTSDSDGLSTDGCLSPEFDPSCVP